MSVSNPIAIRRSWLTVGWLGVVFLIYLSLTPAPPQIDVEQGDKLGHIAAYAVLMAWFVQAYLALRTRRRIALALVALGILLEFAQAQTDYRSFEIADMLADAVGVALGWLLAPPRLPNVLARLERLGTRRA